MFLCFLKPASLGVGWGMCVYVCVCLHARTCVCVCLCESCWKREEPVEGAVGHEYGVCVCVCVCVCLPLWKLLAWGVCVCLPVKPAGWA